MKDSTMQDSSATSSRSKRGRGRPRLQPALLQEPTTVQALERGLTLLQLLSRYDSASLSDLSLQMGLPTSTAYRLLSTLQKMEFVSFDDNTQEWSVGIEAFTVGSSYFNRANLVESSRPVMRELTNDTGETANLAVLTDAGSVTFLTQIESSHPIRAFHLPGTRSHAHASGIGKALLAELNRAQIESIIKQTGLTEFTPNTLTQPRRLFEDLDESFCRGWAFDDEERYVGMRCIAAAIHNGSGEAIAGVSISGPTARFDNDAVSALGLRVREAAIQITQLIGGSAQSYEQRQPHLG
ncbi:MAG: IclR family transcriptional regulator [Granulosicoccus sp.]|nr:IclR family transcriptional regulator [Granulosicoccus sp.]